MMSHEIRTPLNAVLGLASTLLHDGLTPEQQRIVGVIHESGDTLLRILNDILDFSRLDAGRLTLESVPFSPADLTRQVVDVHQPAADAKGVTLLLQDDRTLPPLLRGDAGRVRQVLHNLISNAVKFTDQGGIVVRTRCLAHGIASATLEWNVTDTGIGISLENQAKLFDAFMQADDSITRRFGGSGLGLAISRQLAERMGGSISVESSEGQGSSFTVQLTLPLAEADLPKPVAAVSPADALSARLAAMGRPAQILLAEDNRTNQFLIQQILKDFAIQLDIAVDGNEAVKAAEAKAYDLICMDVRMPIMDGLEATRHIRAVAGPCQAIPILAMTANAFREDQQACAAAGMTDFVPKPISRQALIEAIWRALPAEATVVPPTS